MKCYARRGLMLLGALCLGTPAYTQSPYGLVLDAESRTFSDSFSIDGILNDLDTAPYQSGGEGAFTHNHGRIGASYAPETGLLAKTTLGAGLLSRYDYSAQYNSDTVDYIYRDGRGLDIADGAYDLYLELDETRANGFWISGAQTITPTLQAYARLSYLKTDHLTHGKLTGQARFGDADIQSLNAALTHYFHSDPLFDENVIRSGGSGYTLDIGAQWDATPNLTLHVDISDFASDITWTDVPTLTVDATTDTLSFNADGTLNPRASVQGTRTVRDNPDTYQSQLSTSYAARSSVAADYKIDDRWSLSQDVFNINDIWLTHSAAVYQVSDTLSFGAKAEWVTGALGAHLSWHGVTAELMADSFNVEDMRYLDMRLSYKHPF